MKDIIINNISKTFNNAETKAINNVSFNVDEGELFGLIGPDGSGKTTLFRVLTSLLLPDAGSASVCGFDVVKDYKSIRKSIGYMPGKFSLYQDLSIQENLNFFATVFNTSVIENYDLIKDIYVQLEPFKNRRAGKLSGGMKQKLALCCALIHRPKVLFLDEPTTGVDVVSRKEFWTMLKKLKSQGITILVSTPYMDEAALCERIALIQNGEIMSIDTPQNIVAQFPDCLFAVKANNMSKLLTDLRKYSYIKTCNAFGEFHHITFTNSNPLLIQQLTDFLSDLQHTNIEIKTLTPSIEDCFIWLMTKNHPPKINN